MCPVALRVGSVPLCLGAGLHLVTQGKCLSTTGPMLRVGRG